MVITAGLEKPDTASEGVRWPKTRRIIRAVTSTKMFFYKRKT